MIAGIDPRHRCDRAELADRRVGDLGIVDDIGIVAHLDVEQNGTGADFAIGAESCLLQLRGGIDKRVDRQHLSGHATVQE